MVVQHFGFEKHLVVPNVDGKIALAQLSFGNGMIMLGSAQINETEFGRLMTQTDEIGGGQTQSSYMVVTDADADADADTDADADAVYACAKTAGAKIAIEIKDEDYGGQGFSCLELEGHLWNFSTCDRWQSR